MNHFKRKGNKMVVDNETHHAAEKDSFFCKRRALVNKFLPFLKKLTGQEITVEMSTGIDISLANEFFISGRTSGGRRVKAQVSFKPNETAITFTLGGGL